RAKAAAAKAALALCHRARRLKTNPARWSLCRLLMMSSRFSSLQEKRCHLPHDKDANKAEQGAADRAGEERGEIPAAQQQCTAEVFFLHGAEDRAQHEESGIQIPPHKHIADEAKDSGDENVIQAVVDAVGADAAEEKNRCKQHTVRDLEHRQPV